MELSSATSTQPTAEADSGLPPVRLGAWISIIDGAFPDYGVFLDVGYFFISGTFGNIGFFGDFVTTSVDFTGGSFDCIGNFFFELGPSFATVEQDNSKKDRYAEI